MPLRSDRADAPQAAIKPIHAIDDPCRSIAYLLPKFPMMPFFNGMAIGLALGIVIFAACVVLALIISVLCFGWIVFHVIGHDPARKWRDDRADFAAARAAHGKVLTPAQALEVGLIRAWRILRIRSASAPLSPNHSTPLRDP